MNFNSSFVHSHQMAKKLNNTAALCIETHQYDRGISCLVEALQLSDRQGQRSNHSDGVCQCRHCSLDECIAFSERTPLETGTACGCDDCDDVMSSTNDSTENDNNSHIHPHHHHHSSQSQESSSYIHRRPIRITPQAMPEDHNMGVTLSLIITFNLALAHHLSALSTFGTTQHNPRSSAQCKETFQKILHLYELAYRWQIELEEDRLKKQQRLQEDSGVDGGGFLLLPASLQLEASSVSSLRFNMIISNNLGQIHGLVRNDAKHQRCLEHLLATVMFVVVHEGTTASSGLGSITASSSSSSRRQQSSHCPNHNQHSYMDLDGFLRNASPLILQGRCAGAA